MAVQIHTAFELEGQNQQAQILQLSPPRKTCRPSGQAQSEKM